MIDRGTPGLRVGVAALVVISLVVVAASSVFYLKIRASAAEDMRTVENAPSVVPNADAGQGRLTFERHTDPARTVVLDAQGAAVAVLTDGARTVRLSGPVRTFAEPAFTKRTVTTDAWVRLALEPWREGAENASWFEPWFTRTRTDRSEDLLAVAMEYINGAENKKNAKGIRYAGDASFGPVSATDPDGRSEKSDFYDYLGITWNFPDGGGMRPQPDRYGAVDCSGFVRLVYGYRMGYPLRLKNEAGLGLPRRAYAIAQFGPGALVIPNVGKPARDFDRLQAGDLVFFDTAAGNGDQTDHSGIYLGLDDAGHYRFISSRSRADGPTFGDLGGHALLDGGGYWSVRFRAARRI